MAEAEVLAKLNSTLGGACGCTKVEPYNCDTTDHCYTCVDGPIQWPQCPPLGNVGIAGTYHLCDESGDKTCEKIGGVNCTAIYTCKTRSGGGTVKKCNEAKTACVQCQNSCCHFCQKDELQGFGPPTKNESCHD